MPPLSYLTKRILFIRNHRLLFSLSFPRLYHYISLILRLTFYFSLSLFHLHTDTPISLSFPYYFRFSVIACVAYLRSIGGRSTTRNSEGSLPDVLKIERSRLPKDSSFPRNAQYTVTSAEPEVPRTELRRVSKARHFVGTRFIFMHRFPLATGNGHDYRLLNYHYNYY